MPKNEIRLIGIDDGPFNKFNGGKAIVIGAVFRGGSLIDGILSTKVTIDGSDSTKNLIAMINKCKFKPQLQCIMLDGIAVGGFNVIDIHKLSKKTGMPVIVVTRKYPDFEKIKSTLKKIRKEGKYRFIEKAGKPHKVNGVHIQLAGLGLEEAKSILKIACTRSLIPEPIRVAHLIAAGVVTGESKGEA